MSKIFGGSKSKQSSSNQAFGQIRDTFTPVTDNAAKGANALAALLSGDTSGFNTYKDATGYDFMAEEGSRGITGNAAANGLLRSGSTGKSLVNYGNQLQQTFAGNYMDRLLAQAGLGLQAGQLIASAGNVSKGKSSSKKGLGGFLGTVGAGVAASERRLKKNIINVGKLKNGLNLYTFDYIDGPSGQIGVMVDEVEKILPEALGPVIDGIKTVDYSKIEMVGA
jgi:hypothetical protein